MVRGRVDFDHGQRIEFRVKVNPRDPVDQRGLWPALWASSWNGRGWPRGGEVDWLEYVGKEPTRAHHTIHYPGTDGRRAKTPKAVELGERFSDSWHVIAFDWTDDLVWYIDGREVQRIPAADVEATDNPFLESANPVQIRTRPRRPSGVLTSIQAMWCGLRRNVLVRAATGFGAVLLALTAGAACTSSPERVDTLSDASKLMTDDVGESTTTSTTGSAAAGDSEARQALAVTVDVETEPGDTTDHESSGETATGGDGAGGTATSTTAPLSNTSPSTTTATASTAPAPAPGSARVVGTGSAVSCTSDAVVAAVAAGGSITFDCGPNPVTITMTATAKVVNANGPDIVIDGGNKVTLSGAGKRRILYQNTCDQAQGWTTSHCQNQDHPRLTVRNITLADGNSTGDRAEGGGGGAIFVRGGQLRIENVTFLRNRCDGTGPDLGGAAVRVLSQFEGRPVTVSGSTFRNGVCSNGGAISSIGVSWIISDSVMTDNQAIGNGANPARSGSPGGGSGGAIHGDGNNFTIEIRNTLIENNTASEGGGAVFFVSNNRTGRLSITDSTLLRNPSGGFETSGYPGIYFLGAGSPSTSGSTLR